VAWHRSKYILASSSDDFNILIFKENLPNSKDKEEGALNNNKNEESKNNESIKN
jgi:hypothetical protein